jgi:hypothetical protein
VAYNTTTNEVVVTNSLLLAGLNVNTGTMNVAVSGNDIIVENSQSTSFVIHDSTGSDAALRIVSVGVDGKNYIQSANTTTVGSAAPLLFTPYSSGNAAAVLDIAGKRMLIGDSMMPATTLDVSGSTTLRGATTVTTGGMTVTGVSTFNNNVQVTGGSPSAPSISWIGDTDTGLYSPATNAVAMKSGAGPVCYVDPSGVHMSHPLYLMGPKMYTITDSITGSASYSTSITITEEGIYYCNAWVPTGQGTAGRYKVHQTVYLTKNGLGTFDSSSGSTVSQYKNGGGDWSWNSGTQKLTISSGLDTNLTWQIRILCFIFN